MQLIIILERTVLNPVTINYVLRATVPAARQEYYADESKTSAYKQASAEDIAALKAGRILEFTGSDVVGGHTIAEIKAALQAEQVAFQARVDSQAMNPFRFYGTSWDGITWTTAGVN
jgi:hypothetical protein